MKEAQIKCLCPDYRIPDLGLVLTFGQVVYVPEDKARQSQELRLATKVRAVEVRWGSRCEVSKAPAPPWLKRKARNFPTQEPTVTHEEIERRAKEAARREVGESLRDIIREELQQAMKSMVAAPPTVTHVTGADPEAIVAAVRAALGDRAPMSGAARAPKVSDEPLFIPTGIVPTETKGAVEIPSETSSGEDVADTAAALKAARGRTRKKQE